MGCKQSRKKKNPNNTKHLKTKRRTRDIDQVHEDLKNPERFMNLPTDEDLPGEGLNYCISCARHFQTAGALAAHSETKTHKRRLKEALLEPHTQASAEAAVGYSTARYLCRVHEHNNRNIVDLTQITVNPTLCAQHAEISDHNIVAWEARLEPRPMEISGVRLAWSPEPPESVKISVSEDGKNFHDATSWFSGSSQNQNIFFARPEISKSLKVLMKDSRPVGSFGISQFALVGRNFL